MRVVSNIRLVDFDPEHGGTVTSRFILGEVRLDSRTNWIGKARHTLVRADGAYKMKEKWVYLINNDTAMGNLTFIV